MMVLSIVITSLDFIIARAQEGLKRKTRVMPSEGVSNSSWQPGKRHGSVQPLWTFDGCRDTMSFHGRCGGIPLVPLEPGNLKSIGVNRLSGWKGN